MLTIALNELKFQAYHGVYDEERILGNQYQVNCMVNIEETVEVITKINETINYKTLFDLIKENMEIPTPLLETVCMRIGRQIHEKFPTAVFISITIKKIHPPVNGFSGSSSVQWQKKF